MMRSSASLHPALAATRPPGTPRCRTLLGACLLLACLAGIPAPSSSAQSSQYTAPGGDAGYELPTAESMEQAMEEARWNLGAVRLAPWFGLRGLTYQDNISTSDGESVSDLTGGVGAGLTAILPTGGRVFWVAQVLPEYLFWLDLSERNELIGRYGGGVVADLNRLRLVANAQHQEVQRVTTIESTDQVVAETTGIRVDGSLALTGRLDLVASVSDDEIANRLPGDAEAAPGTLPVGSVDRDEQRGALGLRFAASEAVAFGLGVERTETDFSATAKPLSNTATGPYADVSLDGNHLALAVRLAYLELEPESGSSLVPVEEATGRFRLDLTPGWRFTFGLYGHRHLTYAYNPAYSHLVSDRLGADVRASFGERLDLRVFRENGTAEYAPLLAATPQRDDDVESYGAEISYAIGEWLRYRVGFHHLNVDSNLPGLDQEYDRITSTFELANTGWIWR